MTAHDKQKALVQASLASTHKPDTYAVRKPKGQS